MERSLAGGSLLVITFFVKSSDGTDSRRREAVNRRSSGTTKQIWIVDESLAVISIPELEYQNFGMLSNFPEALIPFMSDDREGDELKLTMMNKPKNLFAWYR